MNDPTREALKQLAQRIEEANEQPISISMDAANAIRSVLSAANAAEATPEHECDSLDEWIIDVVTKAKIQCVHPTAETTRDIGRAILAALPAPVEAQPIKAKDCNIETFSQSDVDGYVRHLTWYVWNTHYSEKSPNFELLPDTVGVLTQLDNMLTGWKISQPVSGVVDERAAFERWAVSSGLGRTYRDTEPGYTDEYQDSHTQQAWCAWQARAALSSNQVNAAHPSDGSKTVRYQSRFRKVGDRDDKSWSAWMDCNEKTYALYLKAPISQGFEYGVRALIASPQPVQGAAQPSEWDAAIEAWKRSERSDFPYR